MNRLETRKTRLGSRAAAWALTFAVALLSAGFGTAKTMAGFKKTAEAYYSGVQSILSDLDRKAGYTYNMITIADKYLDPSESAALRTAINDLSAAKSPAESFLANAQMDTAAAALSAKLFALGGETLKPTDSTYLQEIKTDAAAIEDIISRSAYNAAAATYNAKLNELPVSVFRLPFLIHPLELYGDTNEQ